MVFSVADARASNDFDRHPALSIRFYWRLTRPSPNAKLARRRVAIG
jgi:hypothetical protein